MDPNPLARQHDDTSADFVPLARWYGWLVEPAGFEVTLREEVRQILHTHFDPTALLLRSSSDYVLIGDVATHQVEIKAPALHGRVHVEATATLIHIDHAKNFAISALYVFRCLGGDRIVPVEELPVEEIVLPRRFRGWAAHTRKEVWLERFKESFPMASISEPSDPHNNGSGDPFLAWSERAMSGAGMPLIEWLVQKGIQSYGAHLSDKDPTSRKCETCEHAAGLHSPQVNRCAHCSALAGEPRFCGDVTQ